MATAGGSGLHCSGASLRPRSRRSGVPVTGAPPVRGARSWRAGAGGGRKAVPGAGAPRGGIPGGARPAPGAASAAPAALVSALLPVSGRCPRRGRRGGLGRLGPGEGPHREGPRVCPTPARTAGSSPRRQGGAFSRVLGGTRCGRTGTRSDPFSSPTRPRLLCAPQACKVASPSSTGRSARQDVVT